MTSNRSPQGDTYLVFLGSCSFGRIYNDARKLLEISANAGLEDYVHRSCLPRTALLLFAISLEALANRVVKDIEDLKSPHEVGESLATSDKWKLIPRYHPFAKRGGFDTTSKSWQSFVELIKWRNEYVHPKAVVPDVQRGRKTAEGFWTGESVLSSSEIPRHIRKAYPILAAPRVLGVSRLPTSPYDVTFEEAVTGQAIVDRMTARLDELLSGRLTSARLLEEHDHASAIHPDGVVQDLGAMRGLGFSNSIADGDVGPLNHQPPPEV